MVHQREVPPLPAGPPLDGALPEPACTLVEMPSHELGSGEGDAAQVRVPLPGRGVQRADRVELEIGGEERDASTLVVGKRRLQGCLRDIRPRFD